MPEPMSSWRALLLRIGDKCEEYGGSVDYREHIDTCHSVLCRELDHYRDDILELLLQCAEQLPHKVPFYAVLYEDWEGMRNLVSALPQTLCRFVLVSSVGVTKFDKLPWSIMNLFGVLKFKKMGEDLVRKSGIPFTIIRAGRLTDGPYTSYDLNTLLRATAGKRCAVVIGQGDKLTGEASRVVVAEACIQALDIDFTEGQIYEINSVEGEGPGNDPRKWKELFKAAQSN